jgi:hypothetical protein
VSQVSRRKFLKTAASAGTTLMGLSRCTYASYRAYPLGLQLYSIRDLLPVDLEGTLDQIAGIGYRDVEAAGFYGYSAQRMKAALEAAGLRCVSAHYPYKRCCNEDSKLPIFQHS